MIKFAVIGYGHIGKRHAEMILRSNDAELVAVCDVNESALEDAVCSTYASAEAMLDAHPDCEVVCVCSPNGLHAKHALEALKREKHVVIEKPMALKKDDCELIIHTALDQHKQVFCVMQNRYSPPSEWLKDVISENRLGDIYMVTINCFWNRNEAYYAKSKWKGEKQLDGGVLFTQFSHFIDMMYWLFGDIESIRGRSTNFKHQNITDFDDSGTLSFNFKRGGVGVFNYTTAVYNSNFESSMTIIGEKGTVKVGGQYMNRVDFVDIEGYEMPELKESNPANDYGHYKGSAANHGFVIDNVIETIKGTSKITTNAMDGMKVVEMIERMYDSTS